MRRSLLLALFLAFLAAAPPVTLAQSTEASLDEIRSAIQDRIIDGFGLDLTKSEKKCLKAFQRAEAVLEKSDGFRTADLKRFRKVVKLLKKWFPDENEVRTAAENTADAYGAEFEALNSLIRNGIQEFERPKDIRKLEKLLDKLEGKLETANLALDLSAMSKAFFGASKVCDKALALREKAPKQPSRSATIGGVLAVAPQIGSVHRLISFEFPEDRGDAPVARPISAETGDVTQFEVSHRGGGLLALYRQETDIVSRDLLDPDAVAVNLTGDLEPVQRFELSPFEDCLILWAESKKVYVHRLDDGKAHEVGTGDGDAIFGPDPDRFLLTSIETNPVGRRVDLVEWDGLEYAQTPLAGPSVNGQDAGDVTISPDGTYFACTSIPQSAPGTRLMIGEFATGRSVQVHDSVIAMNSDQDFSESRPIACAWTGDREFLFAAPAGMMRGTINSDMTSPVPEVIDAGSRGFTVHANTPGVSVIHASTPGTLVLMYDSPTLGPIYRRVGGEGNSEMSSAFFANRYLAYSGHPSNQAADVRVQDVTTGKDVVVATPEPDPSKSGTTWVRNLKTAPLVRPTGPALILSFNVVTNDDSKGGIHVGVVETGDDPGQVLRPFEIIVPQEKETTIDDYGLESVADPDGIVQMLMAVHRRDFTTGKFSLLGVEGIVAEDDLDFSIPFPLSSTFGSGGVTFWFK